MVSFAPTSAETLEDQRLYTQARLTEVACLDCLAKVGVKATIEQLEFVPFLERQRAKQFDAAIVALSSDPSPSGMRQHWGTPAAGRGKVRI